MSSTKTMVLCASVILLSACGDSSNSEPPKTTVAPSVGVFIDSVVTGLKYQSQSYSGTTNADGEFNYSPGESVTFSIGGIELGSSKASAIVTPLSLVPTASGANDSTVTNIVRLLLTLDDDANPDNGINLSAEVVTAAANLSVDFSAANLATDSGVTSLFAAVPTLPTLIDSGSAQVHFSASLATQSNWGGMAWGGGTWKSKAP